MDKKNKKNSPVKPTKTLEVVTQPKTPTLQDVREIVKTIPDDVTELPMKDDDAAKVRAFEQNIVAAKLQLADAELQLVARKNELTQFIFTKNQEMVKEINQIAQSYGIDTDGNTDSRKWTFNTNDMVFKLAVSE
jgi:hypothetical protein